MTDHNPLPRCPYCGGEMYEAGNSTYRWYMCPRCLSGSPRKIINKTEYPIARLNVIAALQNARKAAMNRWQEPNRVLTLEEVREYCKQGADAAPLWVGFQNVPWVSRWMVVCPPDEVCSNDAVRNYCGGLANKYNKTWRCWLRKPTAEEMATTPWREK